MTDKLELIINKTDSTIQLQDVKIRLNNPIKTTYDREKAPDTISLIIQSANAREDAAAISFQNIFANSIIKNYQGISISHIPKYSKKAEGHVIKITASKHIYKIKTE